MKTSIELIANDLKMINAAIKGKIKPLGEGTFGLYKYIVGDRVFEWHNIPSRSGYTSKGSYSHKGHSYWTITYKGKTNRINAKYVYVLTLKLSAPELFSQAYSILTNN